MAAHLSDHIPFGAVGTTSGNQPRILAFSEKAGQTFKNGTPVQLTAGVLLNWDGATVAAGIIGVSMYGGNNLATDGKGAPGPFTGVGAPGAAPTWGSVPFMTSAVNFTPGAPMVDGRQNILAANNDTFFIGQVDNATGANFTLLAADIGAQFGLTIDTTGHWYVDRNKNTAGVNTVVQIIGTTVDGFIANARVLFKFIAAAQQIA